MTESYLLLIKCKPKYRSKTYLNVSWGSQVVLVVKNAGDARDMGSVPESGRSPGEGHGNLLQYSCLRYSKDRRILQATVYEAAKSQT